MSKSDEPEIGLFWFVGPSLNEMISLSRRVADVPTVGGFKTVEDGHDAVWRELIKSRGDLARYGYEYFPRGRVNWSEEDGFILLADQLIITTGSYRQVITEWRLPSDTRVMSDPHYRRHSLTTIFKERNNHER